MASFQGFPSGRLCRLWILLALSVIGDFALAAASTQCKLWPGAVVPYVVDSCHSRVHPGCVDAATENVLQAAFAEYERKTVVRFVPRRPSGHSDYVVFRTTTGRGHSEIGRQGGGQVVLIHPATFGNPVGTALHEIGHALGLVHEHQRFDRDEFLRMDLSRMPPSDRADSNITIMFPTRALTPYDPNSIMHYSRGAFSFRPNPSRIPGGQDRLSPQDAAGINRLYGTSTGLPPLVHLNGIPWLSSSCDSAVHRRITYTVCRRPNGRLEIRQDNLPYRPLGNDRALTAPSIVSHEGDLIVVAAGTNRRIYYARSGNGVHWEPWTEVGFSGPPPQTRLRVSAVSANGYLYLAGVGTNGHIYLNRLSRGERWLGWQPLSGNTRTNSAVRIARDNAGTLYLFGRGMDGYSYVNRLSRLPGRSWLGWTPGQF